MDWDVMKVTPIFLRSVWKTRCNAGSLELHKDVDDLFKGFRAAFEYCYH